MKVEKKVIAISIAFGLLFWVVDAVLDFYFFYEGTFWELFIYDVPKHEVYIRLLVLACFIIFGIINAGVMAKRIKTEEALLSERNNLRNIFDSMADGIYLVNQQYAIQYVNPVLVKDYGPYEGVKCYRYFHDRNKVCPWCKNQDVWAGETVRWEWYSSKTETTFDLIDTPLTLPDGSIGKLEIFRDISDRKRAGEEIKSNEVRFRELFNNMGSGVAVYEAKDNGNNFIFKDFNRAGEQIEKIKKENLIDKSVLEIFPGVKEFGLFDVFKRVWETGKPEHHPISMYKDERIIGWRENFVYKLPSGEIVAVYDDITERKQAEEVLKQSEEKYRSLRESM
ncbi:MAG: PAS domain-containing protein [Deltaproteobacteria bacterium]|nr:PAS domain-containing protein [Deltaproteobacteria bacterium]